jgi:protein-S-isoprenylcysteine O-methyltransferase Ste14
MTLSNRNVQPPSSSGREPASRLPSDFVVLSWFLYSIAAYASFLASFGYFAWFTDGVGVSRTVDDGIATGPGLAIIVDVGLVLLFGLQHSVMARAGFKRVLTRVIPAPLERATFVLSSSLVLALLMWQWRPLPLTLWHVDNKVAAGFLWAINAVGWVGVPVCSLFIDHFDLVGLKQAFGAFRRLTLQKKGFAKPLLYRYIRHPMMSALLVGLWVTPSMTLGHLLLSLGMSVYVVVGVHFEERSLVEELGIEYERYQASTPRFVPTIVSKHASTVAPPRLS